MVRKSASGRMVSVNDVGPENGPHCFVAKSHRHKGQPKALLKELADKLSAHMAIEQEIYYPAVKNLKVDLILESYEEHSLAEIGLKRLLATKSSDESFDARVTACKELIEHHVEEEEEELFPAVDRKMKADALDELAEQMQVRFDQAVKRGFSANVPKGTERTSADASHA